MREERLFTAIGGADPALLRRSERRCGKSRALWRRGAAIAACLAVFCAAALFAGRFTAPVLPDGPGGADSPQAVPETLALTGGEVGELHLVQIRYGAMGRDEAADDFVIYVNEESYTGGWQDSGYVIRPVIPGPEGLPECSLTISHREDSSLLAAAEAVRQTLETEYDVVLELEEKEGRISCSGWDGTEWGAEWDAANADVTLVDDRQGGVFVLAARYFTEAAEGHGARFADMVSTFQPVPDGIAFPTWMTMLRETVDALLQAVFSGQWPPETAAFLAEDAMVRGYEEDVSEWVSISDMDFSVDDDQSPAAAAVTIRHRLSAEEPAGYVTMELIYRNGQWLAASIDLK